MAAESLTRRRAVEIVLGFAIVWLLNIVQVLFTFLWAYQWTWNPFTSWFSGQFLGLTQLFYVVPISIYAFRQRRIHLLSSALIAATITFLLTTGCAAIERAIFGPGG